MKVQLKLFATLTDYLPQPAANNAADLDLPDGVTVGGLVDELKLPAKLVHLVLVNGNYVEPALRDTRPLIDGDVLAIWPPIAGG